MKNPGWKLFAVVCVAIGATGCSKKGSEVSEAPRTPKPEVGVVVGIAQLGLKSGDVKSIAFTPVRLVQQEFQVLTDSEKADLATDSDLNLDAVRNGLMSSDEAETKAKAKVLAAQIFQNRLPQKEAIPAVATVTTDGNGAFKFDSLRPGTYWVCLDTKVGINTIGWTVRVEVRAGETTTANLNNTNLDYSFYW